MSDFPGEFQQLLLFALLRLGEPAYGVTLRREIEARTGRKVAAGAVYTTMERMERRGYVSSWLGEATSVRGGKRKRYYRLEPAGRAALYRAQAALRRMAEGLAGELGTP